MPSNADGRQQFFLDRLTVLVHFRPYALPVVYDIHNKLQGGRHAGVVLATFSHITNHAPVQFLCSAQLLCRYRME